MWSATLAFPSLVASSTSLSCYRNCRLPKIQASLSIYPLASKIMVRNLPFSTSEDFLQKEFSAFGEIAEVKLIKDESMKRSKGYAFIQFTSQDDAFLAIETMDRRMYNGRMIYIDIAKPGKSDFQQHPRTSGPLRSCKCQKNQPILMKSLIAGISCQTGSHYTYTPLRYMF